MKVKQLKIKDFMSFSDVNLTFKDGTIFVKGLNLDDETANSNGAGKSALLESLVWCLFGKTMRECSANEVIRRGQSKAIVEIYLEENGKEYIVRRQKTQGKSDTFSNPDNFSLPDWKMFRLCNLFDKDSASFIASPPAERQRVLDYFVNGDIIDKIYEKFKEKEGEIEEEQNTLEKEIIKIETKINTLQESLNSLKQKSFKEQINNTTDIINNLAKSVIPDIDKLKEEYNKEITEEGHLSKLTEKLTYEKITVVNTENSLRELDKKIQNIDKLKGECPVCLRPIREEDKNNIKSILERDKISMVASINKGWETIKFIEQDIKEVEDIIKKEKKKKEKLLDTIQEQNDIVRKIEMYKKMLEDYKKSEQNLNKEIKEAEDKIKKLQKEYKATKQKLETLSIDIDEIYFLKKNFGSAGFRVWRLKRILNILNKIIQIRSSNVGFGIEFITVENAKGEISRIDIKITRGNNEEITYESLSGGEKRKVTIIVLLALHTLLNASGYSINFVICDEVFDTLDDKGIDLIMEMLAELKQNNTQVFIISHLDIMKTAEDFDNTIVVKKINGESVIEEVL